MYLIDSARFHAVMIIIIKNTVFMDVMSSGLVECTRVSVELLPPS